MTRSRRRRPPGEDGNGLEPAVSRDRPPVGDPGKRTEEESDRVTTQRKTADCVLLTQDQVGRLKDALLGKREQIVRQQRAQLSELHAPDRHHLADLEEMASDTMETDSICALFNLGSATLSEIEVALEKIEQDRYGACETCERPIHPDRLEVLPFASLCVDCQRRKEKDRLVHEGEV